MATIAEFYLGKGIQSWVIHMNKYFMHGGHSILMTITKTIDSYVMRNKTGSNTLRLWKATSNGSI